MTKNVDLLKYSQETQDLIKRIKSIGLPKIFNTSLFTSKVSPKHLILNVYLINPSFYAPSASEDPDNENYMNFCSGGVNTGGLKSFLASKDLSFLDISSIYHESLSFYSRVKVKFNEELSAFFS